MTSDGDARVLSYHDVLLRKADVELLRGPHWLNDQVSFAAMTSAWLIKLTCIAG